MANPFRAGIFIGILLLFQAAGAWGQTITLGPNLGTWSTGEIQLALTATGGNGSYSWNLASGILPAGLALRTDVPAFFPPGTAAGLIGVATTPGTYSFTITVTSGGSPVTQACTMKITGFTLKDTYNLPDAFAGSAYSYTLTALKNAGTVTFTPSGTLPAGLNLSTSGVLSGTPTTAGSYNVNFSMNDGVDTIYRGVHVNVSAVQITNPGLVNAIIGDSFSLTLTGTGGTPPYTFSAGQGPPGLSLNPATGLVSGTVTGGLGRWNVFVTITDSTNAAYSKRMTVDVLHPTVTAGNLQLYGNTFDDCTIGIPCSRGISVFNGGTAPFSYTVTGLPAGMDSRVGGPASSPGMWPGDLELWGTPATIGTYNLKVTATDANSITTTETFPLKVSALTMDGADYLPAGTRGTAYSKTLRVLGGTGPYTVTQLPASVMPSGLSLTGVVVGGTPVENGSFNAVLSFSDSGPNSLQTTSYFNINNPTSNVNINNGPNLGTILVNAFYSNQLSACCATGFTWSGTGGTLPPGMTLSAGGLLSGTPTASGTYTFTVRATDQSNAANFGIRVFTLVVTPLNYTNCCSLPNGNIGTPYSQTLPLTGATGASAFTLAAGSYLPPGLTLNGSTGLLSGTPAESGQYRFTIGAGDIAGNTLVRTFNVYIFPAGQTPPLTITTQVNLGTWTIGEVQDALIASGGNGTYSWSLASGTLPSGLALRTDLPPFFPAGTGAGLIGVATTPGTYGFTLSVSSGGTTVSQGFTMKITGLTLKDVYSVPDGFIGSAYSFALTPIGAAGPVTWTSTTPLPPGLNLSSTGVISGTPTQTGTWNVNFRFTDGVDTTFRSFGITVYAIHFTNSRLLPNATQGVAYSTAIAASGGSGSFTFTTPGGLPPGLTLSGSGTITGTTTAGPGRRGFNITATDSNSVSYTTTFSIDVIGVPPSLPAIDPINVNVIYKDATIGFSYARIVSVFNGGTAPFTWSATGLPPGMSIRPWDQAERILTPDDAEIWGTPTATGAFNVQVTVTDVNGASASLTFPFSVSALGVDGNDQLPNGTLGVAYSKTLRVLGGTGPYTVGLFNSQFQTLPAGLALGTMAVSGTPLENGNFTAVLQFQDSAGNILQWPDFFTIGGAANSTVTVNQSFIGTVTVGSAYSLQLNACCTPAGTYNWLLVSGSLPPGITLSGGGLLSGTANTAGTFDFLVVAADTQNPGNFGLRQLLLIVTPLAYTSSLTLPYGNVGSAYAGNLVTSLTGEKGALTVTLQPGSYLPAGLTMTSGTIGGTPIAPGRFGFNVIFTDSANNPLLRSFTLYIYPAGASPALRFVPVTPCRIADTRTAAGPFGGPAIPGGTSRDFAIPNGACGVPATAQAYSLNVTVVPPGPLGYLTLWGSGLTRPVASTLNSLDGRIKSNAAIVPAGAAGAVSVFVSNTTQVVLDINGYFVPATDATALAFYPITPCRIADTRNVAGPLGGPSLGGGTSRTFPIRSACGLPAAAQAYSLNFTAVPGGPMGYLTAWPTGPARPLASSLNALTGAVTANAAIVPAGTGGSIDVFASDATNLVIDINGYFAPMATGGLSLYGVTPCRVVDTRQPAGSLPITSLDVAVSASACGIPAAAQAHVLSVTVVPPAPLGYVTLWPQGQTRPLASTLNALDGAITSNLAIVPTTNGSVSAFASNPTHLIVDISGFFGQ